MTLTIYTVYPMTSLEYVPTAISDSLSFFHSSLRFLLFFLPKTPTEVYTEIEKHLLHVLLKFVVVLLQVAGIYYISSSAKNCCPKLSQKVVYH